jgi:hypothetical protein
MIIAEIGIKNNNYIRIVNRKENLKLINDKCKFHHRNIMLKID